MLSLSLYAILHFSSLRMSLKCTCTSSEIPCISMTPSTDSRLIRRNDSSLLWKSSETSFRFAQEYRVKNLIPFLLKKTLCINPGKFLLLLSTGVYLERLVVLTSFASLELKSFGIYGAVLPKCLTSPKMKESKAYKTYLVHATGAVPPNISRKFKKASPSKKDSIPVQADEEPVQKGKRVKRSTKKYSTTPAAGIVYRETPVKTKSTGKEKLDVSRAKVAEKPSSVKKITLTVTSEGTGDKPEVLDVTEDDFTESESESWEQDEESDDDNQEEEEVDQENEYEDDEIERNENLETTQEQVVEDAHVTTSTVTKKTKVPATSSSRSSDLASKFLNFSDIPHTDAEIVSPFDVPVQHEVPNTQTTTLLPIPVFVITTIPQSLHTFTPPPLVSTPTLPLITEATNPLSTLPDFASVFRFNDRITTLEKEVAKLKKDPLHTQVTTLVDEHLDTRLGETREEFMNFLLESLTARIKEQVKDQLPQILPKEVSNFALPVIEKLIKESRDEVTLAKKDSTSRSSKGTKSQSKSSRKSVQSEEPVFKVADSNMPQDQEGLNLIRTSESEYSSIQSEEPVFEVADSDMPQDQEGNLGDNEDEPRNETASRRDWFKKPTPPQEPTDLDWNIGKTTQEGPTQNWLMTLAASTSTDKSLKDFDELMSTPIDFSGYILNGLKIENLTQEILLGPAFRLFKGTRSNYAGLKYDFEECYKALSEKLDWENPKGGDYPFDLSKPLPLITCGKRQRVPFEFFINNDLKYLQGGISTMTHTTSTTKTKAANHSCQGYEETWIRYLEEIIVRRADNVLYRFKEGDDVADFAIALRMFTISLVIQKRVEDLQLGVESYQKKINVTKPDTTRPYLRKRHPYTPYKDPQGFIYVDDYKRNRLMRSDELYKFSDGTLTRLLSSLEDITNNIDMEYLPKRRWSNLEKKRAHFMIKDINKLLKERRMMRSLEKFIGGRLYELTSDCCKEQYDFVILCSYLKEPKGSTQGYPLDSVEVLRYDTKGEKVRIGNNAD
ncbi:hypothetical protein Tco_0002592 [Tanacetum coccineum]